MPKNLSYWEYASWLAQTDFTVVGSGIVGLNCAIHLKERHPKANVLILEKGMFPQGASTKNAGFACFGSISELLSDRIHHTDQEILDLVSDRNQGITYLRNLLGDDVLEYQQKGGHELFLQDDKGLFETCWQHLSWANGLLEPVFGPTTFEVAKNRFQFQGIHPQYITQRHEGQLHTGNMMKALLHKAQKMEISILNGIHVHDFSSSTEGVTVQTNAFTLNTKYLMIATNGFAKQLIAEDVRPARAQVLITKPIPSLKIEGTFHLEEGYYYFRNVADRILLGGGRNLDFEGEETMEFGQTERIQRKLEQLLAQVILPNQSVEIDHRWSGIMGIGPQKKPIIKELAPNVACGVRLGGMGVAIGASTGIKLAQLMG
jgi:glycine/D-amino acid oxidase-like deaminating enzyme